MMLGDVPLSEHSTTQIIQEKLVYERHQSYQNSTKHDVRLKRPMRA